MEMPGSSIFTPGLLRSTTNMVMPPRWRFSGSVTACTRMKSDSAAPEIHILVPLMTQPSPFGTAEVFIMPPGSEPALGSVCAKQ